MKTILYFTGKFLKFYILSSFSSRERKFLSVSVIFVIFQKAEDKVVTNCSIRSFYLKKPPIWLLVPYCDHVAFSGSVKKTRDNFSLEYTVDTLLKLEK